MNEVTMLTIKYERQKYTSRLANQQCDWQEAQDLKAARRSLWSATAVACLRNMGTFTPDSVYLEGAARTADTLLVLFDARVIEGKL